MGVIIKILLLINKVSMDPLQWLKTSLVAYHLSGWHSMTRRSCTKSGHRYEAMFVARSVLLVVGYLRTQEEDELPSVGIEVSVMQPDELFR